MPGFEPLGVPSVCSLMSGPAFVASARSTAINCIDAFTERRVTGFPCGLEYLKIEVPEDSAFAGDSMRIRDVSSSGLNRAMVARRGLNETGSGIRETLRSRQETPRLFSLIGVTSLAMSAGLSDRE